MKKKLFIGTMLALLALFAAVPCFAATVVDSGNCGAQYEIEFGKSDVYDVNYTFYSDGKMVISGSGKMQGYMDLVTPWNNYKEAIKILEVQEGVESIGELTFIDCVNLTDVKLADTVTTICGNAFNNCISLKNINTSHVTKWIWAAFSGCQSIETLHIPSFYLWWWWPDEFKNCSSLKNITVDPQNESISAIDGVLFSKDKTEIYHYPAAKPGKTYSISDNVKTIHASFSDCSNLTALEIPTSVTLFMTRYMFDNSSITDIYYNGTEEQWNEIQGVNQVDFTGITIHFNSTLPEEVAPFKVTYFDDYCKVENISDTVQHAYITVAGYTNNGALGEITEYRYTSLESGGSFTYVLPANGKIFVWDSIEGMKPLNK